IEVAGSDAVFRSRRAHANHFLRAQVGRDESQSADPGWQRASGLKEIFARLHKPLECEANAQHKSEIQNNDEPVDNCRVHVALLHPFIEINLVVIRKSVPRTHLKTLRRSGYSTSRKCLRS